MGLRKEGGCRRCQAIVNSGIGMPRCGPASPCKGHLSTKSNALCVDSSRNLGSQYLIRDHMVFHYNRILSAKAVDTSAPKSRSTSIKLADQQRREKLRKRMGKCEQKVCMCEAASQSCSKDNGRPLPSSFKKTFLEVEDNLFPCSGQAQCLSKATSPCAEHCLVHCSPMKITRKCCRNTTRAPYSNSSICVSRPPVKHTVLSRSRSTESFVNIGCSHKCRGHHHRARSGDILETHSEYFTRSRKPFTPRTLISDAKPFLSEYRFYTPAQRKKKNHHKLCVEAQTQTDMISFPAADKTCVRKVTSKQRKITSKAEDKRHTLDEHGRGIGCCQASILRETGCCPHKSSPKRIVDTEEEELLYLTFIEDVTNEILRLGVFSNRVLDELFECYIEANKNRLNEDKMRQMLEVLKSDLGCGQDSETELMHAGQEALDPLHVQEFDVQEQLEFTSKGHRVRKATKSEEFSETTEMSLKEPNKCESMSWSERSRETQIREEFSQDTTETMDAGTESDSCGVEFEEHPGTSHTCKGALNLMACDSDSEVNKEIDELKENFAGTLHISHKYS
ncbi:spermatogenesis-associated protein 7 isoform X2 [Poecile atricapillus]|uniref:spermatogenesis-associated protein 7 isoform X2 n=1 Tax=Poecile atricapillus TaxID=48891 RepID=UPI002738C811|nr:spermatogenesis-associated protein 7 isoform X2 [Poecile atricapillus]